MIGVDVSQKRVEALNNGNSPIDDIELSKFLSEKKLNLSASTDLQESVSGADYVIVSTTTNFDEEKNFFDTSLVEKVIAQVISCEPKACIVVKSAIPIGYVDYLRARFNTNALFFSPEFLREGLALRDNLYPSRIVVGDKSSRAKVFARLLVQGAMKKNIDCLFTGTREAEAIKLFANTYLAMRVAFFNELDNYAFVNELNSKDIIDGVSLDARIGNHYNNPSFGYGGHCLPKDTKQLLASYEKIPQNIIEAIVKSNSTRMDFLAEQIIRKSPKIG